MRKELVNILRAPKTGNRLIVHTLLSKENDSEEIINGLLWDKTGLAFPIVAGVPVMIEHAFNKSFLDEYSAEIQSLKEKVDLDIRLKHSSDGWSFSKEWQYHFDSRLQRTWGWTTEERMEQFYLETLTDPLWCKNKWILDAGCGNGKLTNILNQTGVTIVGIDYSTSVFEAEKNKRSKYVHFILGDLQLPPFATECFDLIVSNGVLHHTPNTKATFFQVAKLVKPGGRFYLWLYRRSEKFVRRYLIIPALDVVRKFVSRLPRKGQTISVKGYAALLHLKHQIWKPRKRLSYTEKVISAYDSLTCLWRHYHTPMEVSSWFFENGFGPASLTHWDNPNGFGMVATKQEVANFKTPGSNWGIERVQKRFYR